jgi:hypothetical protein
MMTDPRFSVSRRRTMAWMLAAAASSSLPAAGRAAARPSAATPWPTATPPAVAAPGYGTDPDFAAKTIPWPLTLHDRERAMIRVCADLILPPAEGQKAPSALQIDAFFDEWVSAPYTLQRADRALIVPGLAWLDADAGARFGADFLSVTDAQRTAIFDSIADKATAGPAYQQAADFFDSLRRVTVLGYYTTPEGMAELGFVGDTPIEGVYPGPGPEALAHLQAQLQMLGLAMPD